MTVRNMKDVGQQRCFMPNSYFRNINIGKPFYAIFYNTPYTKVSQNYSKKKKSETDVHSFKSIDFI